jgi:DNA repair protein RadC
VAGISHGNENRERGPSPIERLYLLSYDKKGNFLQETLLFQGGSLSCGGEEKLILGEVLRRGAASFAIVHNHPSGSALPSREDFAYTASLKIKAEELSLAFLDHLILTRSAFYSFRENGLLR